MWGSDFPHIEGWAYYTQASANAFAASRTRDKGHGRAANAARVYGFDLDALAPLAPSSCRNRTVTEGPPAEEIHDEASR